METKPYPYKVGDIVVPADGSRYRGVITYISKEEDTVRHRCTETGKEWEKSYFGFTCRYMTPEEFAAAEARREAHCPQCGVPRGEHHKMSCSEPGGRKGTGPIRPFGEEVQTTGEE